MAHIYINVHHVTVWSQNLKLLYHISKIIEIFGFIVLMLLCCFYLFHFRIRRNYKICSLLRKNLYMGLSQVPGEAAALGHQMDTEHMEMDQWLPRPVGTQLAVQLQSSSRHVLILDAKMVISRKWEGSLLLL